MQRHVGIAFPCRLRVTSRCFGRTFASCANDENPTPAFYTSDSLHPHFNLSLEHALLRKRPSDQPVGLVYRNQPCIVIGRNQNPWRELDVAAMQRLGLRLVRRRSGGGAVYHDLGNSNFSFHVARERFARRTHAELVARALNGKPISLRSGERTDVGDIERGAFVNERNDVCVALQHTGEQRKVSGSAFKITTSRAYHHGTMLLSSDLEELGTSLRPCRARMQSKGVVSVPSPVINLAQAFQSRKEFLTHSAFCLALKGEFEQTYGNATLFDGLHQDFLKRMLTEAEQDELLKSWREMDSWEWTWGQTPEFTHNVRHDSDVHLPGDHGVLRPFTIELHVQHGIIRSATLRTDSNDVESQGLQDIVARFVGVAYDVLANAPKTFSDSSIKDDGNDKEEIHPFQREFSAIRLAPETQDLRSTIALRILAWLKEVL